MIRLMIALLLLAAPAHAFVSKLVPYGGPINCEAFGAVMLAYTIGQQAPTLIGEVRTAGQISTMLQTKFLTPAGQTWSANDTGDNGRLVTKLNGLTNLAQATAFSLYLKGLCSAQEQNTFTLTQEQFLSELGIPRP